ncbi:MAG: hypothetical protein ACHQ0I_02465, partial [Candidatus Lutacidiplasmatales archaeon]
MQDLALSPAAGEHGPGKRERAWGRESSQRGWGRSERQASGGGSEEITAVERGPHPRSGGQLRRFDLMYRYHPE